MRASWLAGPGWETTNLVKKKRGEEEDRNGLLPLPKHEDVFPLWEKLKSSGLGLSLNGSQFGGCSTKYNTLADT